MTLPMATRSYARVSRDLITTAICFIAAALIVSALARRPETSDTQDGGRPYQPSSGQLYRLSPIPPGADWTS
jgi:hypothetical protein